MKWRRKYVAPPQYGDIKIVRKFLLFPRVMTLPNQDKIYRWLEFAEIRYRFSVSPPGSDYGSDYWRFDGFTDELLLNKVEGKS